MIPATALFLTALAALPAGRRGEEPLAPRPGTAPQRPAREATLTVVVHLAGGAAPAAARAAGRAERLRGVAAALRARAEAARRPLEPLLEAWRREGKVTRVRPFWIVNGFSLTATPGVIRELAARPEVSAVTPDALDLVTFTVGPAEPGVAAVGAPALWSLGLSGAGVEVAILDTGVDVGHPDLAARWRGGPGGWFDPYGQHATPHDPSGHGTWTAGVVVGGDAGGTSVGVAPGARFIAAKIFPDSGAPSATAIHAAFEWVLDPDGDPATADAPRIVNGSWGFGSPGCNPEFQDDVRALRAAGILPVFAAGNFGPGASTSVSPANYPESLAVGAVDANGNAYGLSSRGPSACGGGAFPALAAPGVDVWTTDLLSWYLPASGTSVAAPHVSGVAALLAGAFPGAAADDLQAALLASARDLGAAGPDADTGRGMVDAPAAHALLAGAPPPAPVAADDAFALDGGTSISVPAPGLLANDSALPGASLTAALAAAPAHGILALRADGGFDYTPDPGWSGVDGFRYRAVAAGQESAEAAVTLTVSAPPPTPPVAAADGYTLAEDGVLSSPAPGVLANDTSPSGRPLAAVLLTGPAHGTLTLRADGSFDYRPLRDFAGVDTFTYRAADGALQSAPATVTLAVSAVNDAPLARNDQASTRVGVAVLVAVLANDGDVDGTLVPSTLAILSQPRHGNLTVGADGQVTYGPARGYRGTDSFAYRVRDDAGAWSNVATARIKVN